MQKMLVNQTPTTQPAALSPAIASPNNNQSKDLLGSSNNSSSAILSNMRAGRENSIRSTSSPSPSSSSPSSPSSTHSSSTASSSTSTTYTKPSLSTIAARSDMLIPHVQRTKINVASTSISESTSNSNTRIANQNKQTPVLDDLAKTRRASLEQFQGISGVSWNKLNIATWLKDEVMFNKLNSAINLRLQQQKQENVQKKNKRNPENKSQLEQADYSTMSKEQSNEEMSKKNTLVQASYLPTLEKQYCKDYACCGLLLPSLHDLLDHYEEVHTASSLSRSLSNYSSLHLNNAHSTITSLRSNHGTNNIMNNKKRSSSSVETPNVKAFALKGRVLNTGTKKNKLNRAASTPESSQTEPDFAKPTLSNTGKSFSLANKNDKTVQQSSQTELPKKDNQKAAAASDLASSGLKDETKLQHHQPGLKDYLNKDNSKIQKKTLTNDDQRQVMGDKDLGINTKDTYHNTSIFENEKKIIESKQSEHRNGDSAKDNKHQNQDELNSDNFKNMANNNQGKTEESAGNHAIPHNEGASKNNGISSANSDMNKIDISATEDEKSFLSTSHLDHDHHPLEHHSLDHHHRHHAHIFKRPSSVSPLTISEKAKDSLLHDGAANKHSEFRTNDADYEACVTSVSNSQSRADSLHDDYGNHTKIADQNNLSSNGLKSEDHIHAKNTVDMASSTIYMNTGPSLARAASISMPISSANSKSNKTNLDSKSIPGTPKHRNSVVAMASPASLPIARTASLAFPSKTSMLKKNVDDSLSEFSSSTSSGMTRPGSTLKLRTSVDQDELVRVHSHHRSRTSSITSSMRSIHSDDEDFARYAGSQTNHFQNSFSDPSGGSDVSKSFININELVGNTGFANEHARRLYLMELEENKPFKCPVIGCGKMYKNQNGLKYHRAHGHQGQKLYENADGTFSIIDPVSNQPYPDGVEFETDKPYRCDVCAKRYKNLNGLKYHRAHSTH